MGYTFFRRLCPHCHDYGPPTKSPSDDVWRDSEDCSQFDFVNQALDKDKGRHDEEEESSDKPIPRQIFGSKDLSYNEIYDKKDLNRSHAHTFSYM
jgi:hypothetical protein